MNSTSGQHRMLEIKKPVKRFQLRVFLYLMLLSLATSAISGGMFYRRQMLHLEVERKQRASTLLSSLATQLELGVYARDAGLLDLPTRAAFHEPDVEMVAVYDTTGKELIRHSDPGLPAPPPPDLARLAEQLRRNDAQPLRIPNPTYDDLWLGVFTVARPSTIAMVTDPGLTGEEPTAVGLVRIGLSLKPAQEQLDEVVRTGAYLGLTLLVLGAIVSSLIARRISDPVLALASSADQIAAGNLDVEISINSDDEIGQLARSFRFMASQLKEILKKLEDLNRGLEGEVMERTEEIRNTAEISQRLNAPIMADKNDINDELRRLLEPVLNAFMAATRVPGCAILLSREDAVEFELIVVLTCGAPMATFVTMPTLAELNAGKPLRQWNGVTVPMQLRGQPEGAIVLLGEDVSERAVQFAERASSQLAIAITNVRAFGALRHMADELTIRNDVLTRQRDQLQEMNRLKSEFLANVSHELRTPMNAILGYAELIQEQIYGPTTPDQNEGLDGILDSGRSLLHLINQILDLSKVESGRMDVSITDVDLVDLAESVTHETRSLTKTKPYQVKVIATDRVRVLTDHGKVKQILTNLLANAIKFTEQGRVDVEIRAAKDGFVQVRVRDTGLGIKPEHQEIIFEEFRQVDGSATRRYGGTGLGLAICKRFALLLGGKLSVESRLNLGSTFTLLLPVEPQKTESAPAAHGSAGVRKSSPYLSMVVTPAGTSSPSIPVPSMLPPSPPPSPAAVAPKPPAPAPAVASKPPAPAAIPPSPTLTPPPARITSAQGVVRPAISVPARTATPAPTLKPVAPTLKPAAPTTKPVAPLSGAAAIPTIPAIPAVPSVQRPASSTTVSPASPSSTMPRPLPKKPSEP